MSLSSVSSALSLNERWVLLHRQPRGPRKGPPRLLLIPLLRSPILQGADSSEIGEPASPPPAQPHFPVITTTTKVARNRFTPVTVPSSPHARMRARAPSAHRSQSDLSSGFISWLR